MLLMVAHSLEVEHKLVENSAKRPSRMENSAEKQNSMKNLAR